MTKLPPTTSTTTSSPTSKITTSDSTTTIQSTDTPPIGLKLHIHPSLDIVNEPVRPLSFTIVRFLPLVIDHYLGNKSLPW